MNSMILSRSSEPTPRLSIIPPCSSIILCGDDDDAAELDSPAAAAIGMAGEMEENGGTEDTDDEDEASSGITGGAVVLSSSGPTESVGILPLVELEVRERVHMFLFHFCSCNTRLSLESSFITSS